MSTGRTNKEIAQIFFGNLWLDPPLARSVAAGPVGRAARRGPRDGAVLERPGESGIVMSSVSSGLYSTPSVEPPRRGPPLPARPVPEKSR